MMKAWKSYRVRSASWEPGVGFTPWGSETRIRSCGGAVVLVDEPAEQIPPANISRLWPDDRFVIVWVFEPGSSGDSWRLRQVPQLLLAGDRAEPIA